MREGRRGGVVMMMMMMMREDYIHEEERGEEKKWSIGIGMMIPHDRTGFSNGQQNL